MIKEEETKFEHVRYDGDEEEDMSSERKPLTNASMSRTSSSRNNRFNFVVCGENGHQEGETCVACATPTTQAEMLQDCKKNVNPFKATTCDCASCRETRLIKNYLHAVNEDKKLHTPTFENPDVQLLDELEKELKSAQKTQDSTTREAKRRLCHIL